MSTLRRPSLKAVYAFVLAVSGLAVYYLPRPWVPDWRARAVYLEMAFVAGAFLFELRRDRRDAEAEREAELRAREADPLRYGHQPARTRVENNPPVT